MRRSRHTYTLAIGEWTAGNHDQAGHRSGTKSFGKSGVHACNMYMAHPSPPMEVEWSDLCVSTKADVLSAYIYVWMYNTHCLQSEYFNMTPTIILYYPVMCMFVHMPMDLLIYLDIQ